MGNIGNLFMEATLTQ